MDTQERPARKRKIIPVFNSMYTNILSFILLSCQHNEDTVNFLFKFLHLLTELVAMFLATVLLLFYFEMDCEGRQAAEQIDLSLIHI